MAEPISFMMLAGAAVSAVGAMQQANAAKAAGMYNARMNERAAIVSMDQAKADAERVHRDGVRAAGSLIAGYGASGVATDEGSPLDVLRASETQVALDVATINYRGKLKATGYYNDAMLNRHGAEVAGDQGPLNAASYLLTGAGRAGSTYAASQRPLTQSYGSGGALYNLD
jgi:hypothetical protein